MGIKQKNLETTANPNTYNMANLLCLKNRYFLPSNRTVDSLFDVVLWCLKNAIS